MDLTQEASVSTGILSSHASQPRFRKLLGNGRSATVYRMVTGHGDTARKVFTGSTAAAIAHLIFYGAPLDYRWNQAAVESAYYRRKTLRLLLKHWFGNELSMADAYGWGSDKNEKALYLDTAYCPGQLARLYSPFYFGKDGEINQLRKEVLPKLQHHLREAGFVGTVWQAGYGQPCAFPNFLCIRPDDDRDGIKWVWIDAESGVPAIVSYDLPALFSFYIPQAFKRRRILFDDLNADQLRNYIQQNETSLKQSLVGEEWVELNGQINKLIAAQEKWAGETRFSRSLGFNFFTGVITEAEYSYYLQHRLKWAAFLLRYLARKIPNKLYEKCAEYFRFLRSKIKLAEWVRMLVLGLVSPGCRLELCRKYARRSIGHWVRYQRITQAQQKILMAELHDHEKSLWLADFGVHLAIKPLGYLLRFTLVPLLVHYELISLSAAGVLFVFMGNMLRTAHTLLRSVECLIKRLPVPWIAIAITPIPSIGTLAFPCQMLHSARKGHLISQMIIYETCSVAAAAIPIWGGRDNGWEHRANQFAHRLIWALRA